MAQKKESRGSEEERQVAVRLRVQTWKQFIAMEQENAAECSVEQYFFEEPCGRPVTLSDPPELCCVFIVAVSHRIVTEPNSPTVCQGQNEL